MSRAMETESVGRATHMDNRETEKDVRSLTFAYR